VSAHEAAAPAALPDAPYAGGRGAMIGAAALGAVGLLATLLGALSSPREASFSYLFGFTYWCGISVGALLLLQIFHASNARWPVALRRLLETLAVSVAVFALLFIPVALAMKHLFVWVAPGQALPHEELAKIEHKQSYLNVTFFLVRAAFYFACWIGVSTLLRRWSILQDKDPTAEHTLRQRRLGTGALPLTALTITFASFDWLMSLDPIYSSTIWGLYYFAGSFIGAIAVLIIAAHRGRERGAFGSAVTVEHFHSLGMFLFAFTCFWAYMAYSQGMLNWVANLPHETRFYLKRGLHGFKPIGIALIVLHFVIPFFVLLSRQLKRRPALLSVMAAYLLAVHALDLYWVIMPALESGSAAPHWTVFTSFAGIGGAAVAFGLFRARGTSLVPLGDPYLEQSLRYTQP
jgi:hypothetical protein